MAYPITCYAGFPMPLVKGKFEIVGFNATVEVPASASQITIFDDYSIKDSDNFGKLVAVADIYNTKVILADIKGYAATDSNLSYEFPEPIKIRYGISIAANNIEGGSICVYRR